MLNQEDDLDNPEIEIQDVQQPEQTKVDPSNPDTKVFQYFKIASTQGHGYGLHICEKPRRKHNRRRSQGIFQRLRHNSQSTSLLKTIDYPKK